MRSRGKLAANYRGAALTKIKPIKNITKGKIIKNLVNVFCFLSGKKAEIAPIRIIPSYIRNQRNPLRLFLETKDSSLTVKIKMQTYKIPATLLKVPESYIFMTLVYPLF